MKEKVYISVIIALAAILLFEKCGVDQKSIYEVVRIERDTITQNSELLVTGPTEKIVLRDTLIEDRIVIQYPEPKIKIITELDTIFVEVPVQPPENVINSYLDTIEFDKAQLTLSIITHGELLGYKSRLKLYSEQVSKTSNYFVSINAGYPALNKSIDLQNTIPAMAIQFGYKSIVGTFLYNNGPYYMIGYQKRF